LVGVFVGVLVGVPVFVGVGLGVIDGVGLGDTQGSAGKSLNAATHLSSGVLVLILKVAE
jgi:hypothetical protein